MNIETNPLMIGSLAAWAMSLIATYTGLGVPAGSLYAILQRLGMTVLA